MSTGGDALSPDSDPTRSGSGTVGEAAPDLEVVTMGRVGVDLYPHQPGPLAEVAVFGRYLGGTATNVAVAAARLGRRSALVTKVGADPFGDYVRQALAGFGVHPGFVGTDPTLRTPVVFTALDPPEDPPLLFYREPSAPDLQLRAEELPLDEIARVPLLWVTGTGLSVEPSRSATLAALEARSSGHREPDGPRFTALDLDYRPMFWDSGEAARAALADALPLATVVVGNRAEVEVAVGTAVPDDAADRLLAGGARLAVVKLGGDGVMLATLDRRVTIPPVPVEVVCGLGAGDAFGGALCHGLLAGWELERAGRAANAAGALVAGRLACADAMPTLDEIERTEGERQPSEVPRASRAEAAHRTLDDALDDERWAWLLEERAQRPDAIETAYANRRRPRTPLGQDGRMFVIAADHPARGALSAGADPQAMADRRSLVARLCLALEQPGVDGVLATPDIVEDLLLLGVLDDRLVFGSMNRGGLAGATWELDDPTTGYTPEVIEQHRLDGGKLLVRLDDQDPGTRETLTMAGRAVSALAASGHMAMVEPLPYRRDESGRAHLDPDPDRLVRAVAVASGLGASSARTWLKVPATDAAPRVLGATSLPCLLLGGDPGADAPATYARWEAALGLPNARGLVVGRALLYPPDGDVAGAVGAAARLVHPETTT